MGTHLCIEIWSWMLQEKKENNVLEKFLILSDIHAGWENKHVRGRRVVQATHDEPSLNLALDFANDFQPDTIVFAGDQINCAPISHWNNQFPGRIGNFRLVDELDYFNDMVLAGLRSKKRVRRVWHRGNHEKWFSDLIDRNPGLDGLTSLESHLRLEARGFEVYDYGEASELGKIKIVHGDNIPGGVNVARIAALRYATNIFFGHFHSSQSYTLHNPLDTNDTKIAVAMPCLANVAPAYGNNSPNNHVNGLTFGYLYDDGNFNHYTALFVNGRAVIEGKEYAG